MNRNDQTWQRLTAAARRAPDEGEAAAPYGFATRVVAQAWSVAPSPSSALLEKFALRGLIAATVFSLAAAVSGYAAFTSDEDYAIVTGDLVTEVLAQS